MKKSAKWPKFEISPNIKWTCKNFNHFTKSGHTESSTHIILSRYLTLKGKKLVLKLVSGRMNLFVQLVNLLSLIYDLIPFLMKTSSFFWLFLYPTLRQVCYEASVMILEHATYLNCTLQRDLSKEQPWLDPRSGQRSPDFKIESGKIGSSVALGTYWDPQSSKNNARGHQ